MHKLSDTQSILLSTAAQREGGSLYPLSDKLRVGTRLSNAVDSLLRSGFVDEREATAAGEVYRTDGDLRFGLYATVVGLKMIGIGEGDAPEDQARPPVASDALATRVTKATAVLELLQREAGATLPELIDATGWLPHTTRAALTGLRKKGHVIERTKRDGDTCYHVVGAA